MHDLDKNPAIQIQMQGNKQITVHKISSILTFMKDNSGTLCKEKNSTTWLTFTLGSNS